ncbi:MAG TPA: hypothetical protein QGH84_04650 [Rhodospirillales bacterium]|jgi:hypothetical protein|nr:hypothetical protein [Rhodospirillales bacterium]
MIDIEIIKDRTQDQDFWAFAEFVIAEAEGKNYPDYKAMDLMQIHLTVPYIWVFDFRNGLDDGLPIYFSGTAVDTYIGRTLTGLDYEKIYPGDYYEELINNTYHQIYLQKRPCYTRRIERFVDDIIDKYVTIESLMFPCSSDDKTINYGLGMLKYMQPSHQGEPEFVLL